MTQFLGVVSQKGGVGKSTLARLIAKEYAANGWRVKIADMDTSQATSYIWQSRRLRNNVEPAIAVEMFQNVDQAVRIADSYDLIIFDGAPHSTSATLKIAQQSDLVILPSGLSLDDLEPTVKLAHEMRKHGIHVDKLAFALCRIGDSEGEVKEVKGYIEQAGYFTLSGALPERLAYRRASDTGRAATETTHSTLNRKADQLVQAIDDRMKQISKRTQRKGTA